MKNEVVVYWANNYFNYEALEPDYAIKDLHSRVEKINELDKYETKNLIKCPVATLYLKNTFRVKSPIDYSICWDKKNGVVNTEHYDQNFFNKFINVRDVKSGIISMKFGSNVFFTEEDNLIIEYKSACYAENTLANNINIIHGEINIGQYFRYSDFACFINRPGEFLNVKRGEALYYVRFLTDKKVVLKKFNCTPEMSLLVEPIMETKHRTRVRIKNTNVWGKMEVYYNVFKTSQIKSLLVKKIKENILE